jgi:hypothetical protein
MPSPSPIPSSSLSPSPTPTPSENEKWQWWPYLVPLAPLCAFAVERIAAVQVLNNLLIRAERENKTTIQAFLKQCLQFVRDESAFNMLMGATAGVAYTANQKMNWNRYNENGSIFMVAAALFGTEAVLNALMECYDAYVQKRPHDFKALAFDTIVPTLTACIAAPLSLYYLLPNYTVDNFLLATLGAQGIRQCMALGIQGIRLYTEKVEVVGQDEEDNKLILNEQEEIPSRATPELTRSVSAVFKVSKALLAIGTTVGVVAATLWVLDESENQYTPAEDTALNAGIGGMIGVLSTTAVTAIAVGTGIAANYCSGKGWGSVINFFSCCKKSDYEGVSLDNHVDDATDDDILLKPGRSDTYGATSGTTTVTLTG